VEPLGLAALGGGEVPAHDDRDGEAELLEQTPRFADGALAHTETLRDRLVRGADAAAGPHVGRGHVGAGYEDRTADRDLLPAELRSPLRAQDTLDERHPGAR
jgi:hypothetical protein